MASDTTPMGLPEVGRKVASFERHMTAIGVTLILAVLSFNAKFMWSANAQLAEIVADNKNLTVQVAELKGTISSLHTNFVTRNEFGAYLERVRALESKK